MITILTIGGHLGEARQGQAATPAPALVDPEGNDRQAYSDCGRPSLGQDNELQPFDIACRILWLQETMYHSHSPPSGLSKTSRFAPLNVPPVKKPLRDLHPKCERCLLGRLPSVISQVILDQTEKFLSDLNREAAIVYVKDTEYRHLLLPQRLD